MGDSHSYSFSRVTGDKFLTGEACTSTRPRGARIFSKGMVRPPRSKKSKSLFVRKSLFAGGTASVKVRVSLERGLRGPQLPLRIEVVDPVFVLKCKIECALRLLRETQGDDAVGLVPAAEDIELEYRGIPLRDMTNVDRYGIENGSEITAAYMPQPSERDTVPREAEFRHLDSQVMADPGVPSTATIRRIVELHGKQCQMCWRSRWFRAEVLHVYSTSILLRWLDWGDAEWPNFFVKVALATAPGVPPQERDETWRIRWHTSKSIGQLPVVQPRFQELPPLNWVKSFLRTYAASDETQMLREIQATLPRELVEARQLAASRHKVLILGASGVGKSTLVATFCEGPPSNATVAALGLDGMSFNGITARGTARSTARSSRAPGFGGGGGGGGSAGEYWPTVGTKCSHSTVHTPGLSDLQVEVWDTSGNPRFKPLSLVFYRQAQSVILVFDVKSMASFKALSAVGGWMHEFTRLTGHSPRNFPFVLVGNKAENDLVHGRQVMEDDVREWLYKDGGRMPYIETAFGGDPREGWRNAEHVFRTVARNAHQLKENFGRHRPPETVRVAPEAEYLEESANFGESFVMGESFVGSFHATKSFVERSAVGRATKELGEKVEKSSVGRATRELTDKFAGFMRDPLEKATNAAEEMKRSLSRFGKGDGGGVLVVRNPNNPSN